MGTENDVAQKLLQIFQIPYESCILSNCNKVVVDTFKECLDSMVRDIQDEALLLKIDSVLDYLHDTLNTGHWSEVPLNTRQGFSNASFVKALIVIRHYKKSWKEALREGLKCLDLGLLLGAPSENLTRCAELLRLEINKVDVDQTIVRPSIKRKCNDEDYKLTLLDLPGSSVPEVEVPSIEAFNNYYFLPQVPGILKNCMSHWPALTKWQDLGYLLRVAGERTVPVEIGSNYMDQNWSQKLMTVNEYIKKFYLSETGQIGYLAQHNLFDQVMELKKDICIPEYCCCSLNYDDESEVDINAWFGPKGTVSPLHQDPKNNILAQVFGFKRIILFSPMDTNHLYPHEETMLSNTSQVDPLNPDLTKFPKFRQAKPHKCILGPGDMIYIPTKWWHHVTSLEKSFSVSFWWS